MSIDNDTISLAALAGMDTSDIAAMTTRLPEKGVYLIEGVSLEWVEPKETREGQDPLFSIKFKAKILEAKLLNKDIDPETLVGKELSRTVSLWPKTFREELALLKGDYKKVGLPIDGVMGGTKEQTGWLDGFPGSRMEWRVRHYTDKNDVERSAIDWAGIKTESKEAA